LLTKIRPIHRIVGTIIMAFTLYIGATGLWIQWADLRAILTHAPATDPDMMAIRESIDGTGNSAVINAADYAAPALPDGFDINAAVANLLASTRNRRRWNGAEVSGTEYGVREATRIGTSR